MDPRFLRKDFSQLTTLAPPSSNVKRAEPASLLTSKPHKARGITEVSNRNTISRDSTQRNELSALPLRNRNTISKDSTQSDGPFKSEMWNRGATSKAKIENDKPRTTGAILPNDSPGLYAVHQPSPAQQQQQQQQMVAAAVPNGNFNGIDIVAQSAGMTPQRQQQMLQMMQRQMMLQQQQQQQQQWAQQYVQQLQNMHSAQIRQMTPQMQAQIQQMARMGQINGQLGNMMMNDNVNVNANNMQAIVAMQIQQQQQAQAQAQAQQAHAEAQAQHQGQGPQQAHTTLQVQMQAHTRLIYNRLMGAAVAKFGGPENIPQDTVDKIKEQSYAQAQQSVRELLQRRAQQEQQAAMRRA